MPGFLGSEKFFTARLVAVECFHHHLQSRILFEIESLKEVFLAPLISLTLTETLSPPSYAKPILASREGKASPKEQEQGVLAMEALHKQVLPFVLRRTKEEVLSDLPPKIIQDYYCDLSPLQVRHLRKNILFFFVPSQYPP